MKYKGKQREQNITNRKALSENELVRHNIQAAFRRPQSDWDIKMLQFYN